MDQVLDPGLLFEPVQRFFFGTRIRADPGLPTSVMKPAVRAELSAQAAGFLRP